MYPSVHPASPKAAVQRRFVNGNDMTSMEFEQHWRLRDKNVELAEHTVEYFKKRYRLQQFGELPQTMLGRPSSRRNSKRGRHRH